MESVGKISGYALVAVALAAFTIPRLRGDKAAAAAPVPPAAETARAADPCLEGQRLLDSYRALYGGDLRFRHLVVLIPDPIELEGTDYFDGVLEGVEEAVSAGRGGVAYVRDRHWFPWADTDAAAKKLACWEKQPGIVLYRPSAGGDGKPVMVLFVGETPTWGLRTHQLERALEVIDDYGIAPDDHFEYQILGPAFSGTAASLSAVLRQMLAWKKARVAVASGTATGQDVKATILAAGAPGGGPLEKGSRAVVQAAFSRAWNGESIVSYAGAAPSDRDVLDKIAAFLKKRGGSCADAGGNIVLFTESGTTYGSLGVDCFLHRTFPPNLAAIRQAYVVDRADPTTSAPLTRAPSDTKDGTGAKAMTHALALGEVLRELASSRVRFVGIMATDARDVIFLAAHIREQLPDVRLFTLGSDLRYLDESNAPALNGMLVVHTAPDDAERDRSTALESELVRNVYRAGRYLLEDEPIPSPTIQVSFVGNGTLWPLEIFPASRAQQALKRFAANHAAPTPLLRVPVSWTFTFGCFVFVLAAVAALVAAPRLSRVTRHGAFWALVRPCVRPDLSLEDRSVTATLLVVSACPSLLMLVTWLARDGDDPVWWRVSLCIGLTLLTFAMPWWRMLRANAGGPRATIYLTLLATVAAILALALGCGPQRSATFNLLSGGSPVLAGLLALGSFALSLWCARVRLRMLDTHRFGVARGETFEAFEKIVPPIAQALGDGATELARVERQLLQTLRNPRSHSRAPTLLFCGLALSIAIPLAIKWPHTFEPGWRNHVLIVIGVLVTVPVVGNLARLIATWIAFARLLRRLAGFPAVAALRRLPARLARPLEAQLASSGNEITDLAYPVEALGRLVEAMPSLVDKHRSAQEFLCAELALEAAACQGERKDAPGPLERAVPMPPKEDLSYRLGLVDCLLETASDLDAKSEKAKETRELVDDYRASLLAVFIPRYVRHFRLFVPPLLAGSVFSILAMSLYFVQPQRLIGSVIFLWVLLLVSAVLFVYVALDRDPVVSAMSNSPANTVSWNWALVRRVVSLGAVPVASYFAVQYPEFSFWLSNVLGSLTKGLR